MYIRPPMAGELCRSLKTVWQEMVKAGIAIAIVSITPMYE